MNVHVPRLSPTAAFTTLAATALVVLLVRELLTSNTVRTAPVQPVALLAPAPPPPPPAPEEKPPEEQPHELQPLESSELTAGVPGPGFGDNRAGDSAPTGPLGLNEAGTGGSDVFGLAGRPGARELPLGEAGGGGGGNPHARFLQFANQLQLHLEQQLNLIAALRRDCYRVHVAVRVVPGGAVQEVRILKSTGNPDLDTQLRTALLQLPPMGVSPPPDMPWPVGLEVVSNRADCEARSGSGR